MREREKGSVSYDYTRRADVEASRSRTEGESCSHRHEPLLHASCRGAKFSDS